VQVSELLLDLYGRLPPLVREAVDGLDVEALCTPPRHGANPIGWLVWHVARVLDHQVSEQMGQPQEWVTGDWGPRFGVTSEPHNMGYGHTAADVEAIRPESADALVAYFDAVWAHTRPFIERLSEADLDRVVDTHWDPPVTLGVRLISVADDCLQHAGQAAYVRGLTP
jgi:hypothetical protein